MGAKTWMLVYSNGAIPNLWSKGLKINRESSTKIIKTLFSTKQYSAIEDGNLYYTNPPKDVIYAADLGELIILATDEIAIDNPSKISQRFIDFSEYKYLYLFAMHSVVDWFAFAVWENKKLIRSLSISPDNGVIEDYGNRFPFEQDYWKGEYPVTDSESEDTYPLPFHPLDFGESALLKLMGFQYEGIENLNRIDPETIPLVGFKEKKSGWKFW